MTSSSKLVIIDGNAIIHRAYHAMPPLTTPKGEPIGAVQGFLNMLLRIITDHKPTHIAVAWDRKEPTFRHKEYKEYQSHRPEVDKELISQFAKARRCLDAFDIAAYDKKGFEADDIIGTFAYLATRAQSSEMVIRKKSPVAHHESRSFNDTVIVTGDKDQLQLVTDKVKVYMPVKGMSVGALMGEKEVKEKLGVRPDQVIDLKAFMGDPSDNYPGVYGIGPKTAQKLLADYDTYPNTYKHLKDLPENTAKKLKEGRAEGDISYKLAKILTDVDVPFEPEKLNQWSVGNNNTLQLFEEYGLKTLAKRVKNLSTKIVSEKQQKLF